MSGWLSVGVAALTGVAAFLTVLALRAWRHSGSRKVLFLALAFAVFLAKGLLFSAALFVVADWRDLILPGLAFDVAALVLLYLAALRPS
jgi:CHASE2 domain-containing sensor protein